MKLNFLFCDYLNAPYFKTGLQIKKQKFGKRTKVLPFYRFWQFCFCLLATLTHPKIIKSNKSNLQTTKKLLNLEASSPFDQFVFSLDNLN